ncbi:tRNA (N6-threonylcarbamoyladenosine(37)-N6)-methyltransferase TrmO [Chloroflexota bacterium]
MPICMEPIGYVTNDIGSPIDYGWAKVESRIVLRENLETALLGLENLSHLLVVFWMHQAETPMVLHRRPQSREDMPELGLLAQRAKHRPNPIGITTVPLVKITDNEITVRGLDAINGTPVLDIKPYYTHYDSPDEVQIPEWVERLMVGYF